VAAGIPVLVATGRMFRSVRRYLDDVGLRAGRLLPGAAVVDARSGEFLLHEPLDLGAARGAIAELGSLGISPNVYVDDQLYVAEENDYTRRYSVFQRLPVVEVGDLLAWLDQPPTKLVAVAEPPVLAEIRPRLAARLDGRAFLTTSLPYMLEIGNPRVTKGSGIAFVARLLGLDLDRMIAFGDGENDVELPGGGVPSRRRRSPRAAAGDRRCDMPGPADEGCRVRDRGRSRLDHVIDLKAARANAEPVRAALARGGGRAFDGLLEADERWRALVPRVDELRARTKLKGKPTPELLAELQAVKADLSRRRTSSPPPRPSVTRSRSGAEPAARRRPRRSDGRRRPRESGAWVSLPP
jgi:hypothetical protein